LTEAFTSGADVPYGATVAVTKACLSLLEQAGRLYKPPLIFNELIADDVQREWRQLAAERDYTRDT